VLRTRVLTALVLLPIALAAIFLLAPSHFRLAAGLLLLVGSWEFHRLAGLPAFPGGVLLLALQATLLGLLLTTWNEWTASPIPPFALACAAWGFLLVQIWRYEPGLPPDGGYRALACFNALVAITGGWAALSWLRMEPAGSWWILLLLLTIWAADIGAYFTGRAIGGRKLAPRISPGKTWAGFFGGVISAAVVAVVAGSLVPQIEAHPLPLALLGGVTALVSIGGDLFISMHKRTVGLKDTGSIFPGHGGVLDRLDSLLAGAPFFVLGKLLAGL
jgi:phosphatidate cytidylyltransferase